MLRHLISKGWFPFTSPKDSPTSNPYGGEGYKTIAYEIVTDLGRVPDKMLVPVAAGALICGAYKGFLELKTLGITDKIPQFVACQAKGANVLQRAFDAHSHETERMPGAFSIATSTREETVGSKALQVIYESGGSAMYRRLPSPQDQISGKRRCQRNRILRQYHYHHVGQHRELVEVVADGALLFQNFLQILHNHHLPAEAAAGDVVALGKPRLFLLSA